MIKNSLLILIIALAFYLRIVNINSTPPGVYLDEASIGYDAYSLGLKGQDQYGKSWPIYFRSFTSYQSPLYIYLTVLPVKLFGLTPFAIRMVSIISGLILIITTYFLLKTITKNFYLSILSVLILTLSPWSIFFSRSALEANLGLTIFVGGLLFLYGGLFKNKKILFFLGFVTLAVASYAYHSYRIVSAAAVLLFLIIYLKQIFTKFKKTTLLGIFTFILILLPQLFILNTAGSLKRYQLLEYTSKQYFEANGGELKNFPLGRLFFISQEFLSKYFDYLSPKSLFFESDPTAVRNIPDLGAFDAWMFVPFLISLTFIFKKKRTKEIIFFLFLGLISLIPAAITRDNLYFLRALTFLWVVTLATGFGCLQIFNFKGHAFKVIFISAIFLLSLIPLYINYFHLLTHERKADHSGLINELFQYTKNQNDKQFIVDLTENLSYGVALYVYQYDPNKFSKSLNFDLRNYYGDEPLKIPHQIENLTFRPIDWEKDNCGEEKFLAGDEQTISQFNIAQHNLELVKKFQAGWDQRLIAIYKTKLDKCH